MAPWRRRGANKAKANAHLTLGDLVLAKVKGFPAWPAKISRPEDWEKKPDPKKFFVQFYGTEEIAFVLPADIQEFTNEVKTKTIARLHGKTKCFTQAVREICAEYDELEKQRAGGLTDDTDDARVGSEAPSFDGVVDDVKDVTDAVVSNVEKAKTVMEDVGSNLEHHEQRCGETDCQDEKPSTSGRATDGSSPVLSPVLESKSSIGTELNKHNIKSGLEDKSCRKNEVSDIKDFCKVNDFKHDDNAQSVSTDGNKARKLVTSSRKRSEVAADKEISGFDIAFSKGEKSAGHANLFRSRETMKDGKRGKNAFSVDSEDAPKSDPGINSGNKDKNLLKAKTSLKVKNELQESFVDSEEADRTNSFKKNKTQVQGKNNWGLNETLHATKKLKSIDVKDRKTLNSLSEDMKSASPVFPIDSEEADRKNSFKKNKTQVQGKGNLGTNETLHATEKLKRMDVKDNEPLNSLPEDMKSVSPVLTVDSEEADRKNSFKKSKTQVQGKRNLETNETLHATKKLKRMDVKDNKASNSLSKDMRSSLQVFPVDSEEADRKNSSKKSKTQVQGKGNLGTNETLFATEKLKRMDVKDNKPLNSLPEDMKSASPVSTVIGNKALKKTELKRSSSSLKTEKGLSSRAQTAKVDSNDSVCEVLTGTKHHSQERKALPHSANLSSDQHAEMSSTRLKGDADNLAVKQLQRKRRAVCLGEDDDDESKTPVHGGASKTIRSPSLVSEAVKSNDPLLENADVSQLNKEKPGTPEDSHLKGHLTKLCNVSLPTRHPQKENADEVVAVNSPHSPEQLNRKRFPSNVEKLSSISPVNFPKSLPTTKSNAERHKSSKALPKVSNTTQKKADNGSSKSLISTNTLQSQVITHKKKPTSYVERSKTTPKTSPQSVEVHTATENLKELDVFHVDRLELGTEEKSSLYVGSGTPENANTMKHLIAVAQAKRRLVAQYQCHPFDLHYAQVGTPSPSMAQPFLSVSNNSGQADMKEVYEHPTLASPLNNGYHSTSQNQLDAEKNEEIRVGSGQRAVGGSLSSGTEAAMARDAFEGMIETLSRTKESIGRATRLAFDCAKYGIANEVVELLIRKLESETSFHRKVDLFFLVDSITQCSHNHKGIAGASYIPAVQGGLARLLGAAVPRGTSSRENRENRRQCLKVLRLWLERKIFPGSVLRRYMNDIGVTGDDMAGRFSFRRLSRAERSVDDPIREMEGMLVDEYGSNASTIQLAGLLSSHIFVEDDDFSNNASPADPTRTLVDSETSTVTPSDKRHCILEDVDGELEMEDVSGHPKDEKPVLLNSTSEMDFQFQGSDRSLDPALNVSGEDHVIREGSPPLPLDSPPTPPPLPSSPPPPPLSTSLPPPPPPSLLQPPPPLPPPCPTPSLIPQSSGTAQPSISILPSQSSHQSSPLSGHPNSSNGWKFFSWRSK
ncbi:ENHANCER OF AG-4 protein 2 isoform X3 [Medicago truncatula]|uniref:ENHANCER OF AG-4 protein 2 isoform X3 n=1 Tax=Medicago truncatula TaxID=3880 RepID=UPI000D2F20DB|nr:ENHANCER OF AG-4 protein 2 isoform X3 [Medicago truncatula]